MFPPLIMENTVDNARRNAESARQLRIIGHFRFIQLPDEKNIVIAEFCSWMLHSSRIALTAFVYAVVGIIKRCSKKQMIWSHARRVVAFVKNEKPWRNWPNPQFISIAMRWKTFCFASLSNREPAVALHKSPSPQPACFGLFNFGKKIPLFSANRMMIWIDATAVFAIIKKSRTWRQNDPLKYMIGDDSRWNHDIFAVSVNHKQRGMSNLPLPFPATIINDNQIQKSFFVRFTHIHVSVA